MSLPRLLLCLLMVVSPGQLLVADETLPPIKDAPLKPWQAPAVSKYVEGKPVDGWVLGILTETNIYRLNHRINVWISLSEAAPIPGHPKTNDYPYAARTSVFTKPDGRTETISVRPESFLFVAMLNGATNTISLGPPSDGPEGCSFEGGVSAMLHALIRKPGKYKVWWNVGKLESSVVTFAVVPEEKEIKQ